MFIPCQLSTLVYSTFRIPCFKSIWYERYKFNRFDSGNWLDVTIQHSGFLAVRAYGMNVISFIDLTVAIDSMWLNLNNYKFNRFDSGNWLDVTKLEQLSVSSIWQWQLTRCDQTWTITSLIDLTVAFNSMWLELNNYNLNRFDNSMWLELNNSAELHTGVLLDLWPQVKFC